MKLATAKIAQTLRSMPPEIRVKASGERDKAEFGEAPPATVHLDGAIIMIVEGGSVCR